MRAAFAATPDIVRIDYSVEDPAPRLNLKVDQAKAALVAVTRRDVVETMRVGFSGVDVSPLHSAWRPSRATMRPNSRARRTS